MCCISLPDEASTVRRFNLQSPSTRHWPSTLAVLKFSAQGRLSCMLHIMRCLPGVRDRRALQRHAAPQRRAPVAEHAGLNVRQRQAPPVGIARPQLLRRPRVEQQLALRGSSGVTGEAPQAMCFVLRVLVKSIASVTRLIGHTPSRSLA